MLAINATTEGAYILYRYVSRFTHGLGLTLNNGERCADQIVWYVRNEGLAKLMKGRINLR